MNKPCPLHMKAVFMLRAVIMVPCLGACLLVLVTMHTCGLLRSDKMTKLLCTHSRVQDPACTLD